MPGKPLSIVSQDPSDSKSNRLHVDIFRFFSYSFEVYSIDSSQLVGDSPESLQLQPVISQTKPVHMQLTAGSSQAVVRDEAVFWDLPHLHWI